MRPTGSTPQALFMQRLWDKNFGTESRFVDSSTVAWSVTSRGITAQSSGGQGGGGTSLRQCVVTQLYNANYIGVTEFNLQDMSLTGSQFFCAKAIQGRMPMTELIDGETVAYSGYGTGTLPANMSDNSRLATFSITNNEWQVMHPRYLVYDDMVGLPDGASIEQYLILVSSVQNQIGVADADGAPCKYLEVFARLWSYSPYLNGGND